MHKLNKHFYDSGFAKAEPLEARGFALPNIPIQAAPHPPLVQMDLAQILGANYP
jgi:hypothetical protein